MKSDLVLDPDAHLALARVKDAELVFAGYGIVAPEYGWDDYKDVDVRGKIVVLMNFNPPFAGPGVRLWYGRWDYKYLTAAAHGAVGALIVHTTASAGYPWQVLSASADGVRIDLPPMVSWNSRNFSTSVSLSSCSSGMATPASSRISSLAKICAPVRSASAIESDGRALTSAPLEKTRSA